MSVFDICYNNIYRIKNQQVLYNTAPYRYTPVSLYPNYTQEQLNMRRKQEILKYNSNNQNSKADILSKLTNSPSNRLSTTLTQNNTTVPLYNYINNSNAYGNTLIKSTNMWNIIKDDNVAFINNTANKLFRIQILENIDDTISEITYQTQVAIYVSGEGINKLNTSTNSGYSIQLGVDNINVDIKYNNISTGINGYLTYNFNSIDSFSCNLPSFSNYLYLGMLTVTIPELPTIVGYVYDVYLTFNCSVKPNNDNFFTSVSYQIKNYCNLTQDFSLPSNINYYTVIEMTSTNVITIPADIKQIYYVIVGGGGGGSNSSTTNYGGGGGGGGSIVSGVINQNTDTSYNIVIGNGGLSGKNGNNSYISYSNSQIIALGGIGTDSSGGGNLRGTNKNLSNISNIIETGISTSGGSGGLNGSGGTKVTDINGYSISIKTDSNNIFTRYYGGGGGGGDSQEPNKNGLYGGGSGGTTGDLVPGKKNSGGGGGGGRNNYTNISNVTIWYNVYGSSLLIYKNNLYVNKLIRIFPYISNFYKLNLTDPSNSSNLDWGNLSSKGLKFASAMTAGKDDYLYLNANFGSEIYDSGVNSIAKISFTNPDTSYNLQWATTTQLPTSAVSMAIDDKGGYLYALMVNNGNISQISLSDPTIYNSSWLKYVGMRNKSVIVIDDYGYMYIGYAVDVAPNFYTPPTYYGYICKINLSNPDFDFNVTWAQPFHGLDKPRGMIIIDDYLYVSNLNNTISKINIFNPDYDYTANWATSSQGINTPMGIASDGSYLYTNTGSSIGKIKISPLSPTGGSGAVLLFYKPIANIGIGYNNYIVDGKTIDINKDNIFLNFNNNFINNSYYYYDGSKYWTNLVFCNNGTVTISNMPIGKSVYILLVGGGGGGGGGGGIKGGGGGGGGGGGLVQTQIFPSLGDVFTITIGSGGNGGCIDFSVPATNGGNTTVTTSISEINITAYGGGAGGQNGIGKTGASSGGNPRNTVLGSAPVLSPKHMHTGYGKYIQNVKGNLAGITRTARDGGASGGGGAGGVGGDGFNTGPDAFNTRVYFYDGSLHVTYEQNGCGGVGLQYSLKGIRTDYYWAGGGGGGAQHSVNNNSGGLGGGGGGAWSGAADGYVSNASYTIGSFNGYGGGNAFRKGGDGGTTSSSTGRNIAGNGATNTGGGGGGNASLNYYGGNGGSGIVIIAIQQ